MNKRIENLDILRCFAMLMIVGLHVVGLGGVKAIVGKQGFLRWGPVSLLQYAFLCSVNVFMLLSGFFGVQIKFRYSRIAMLYLQTLFWSFALAIIIKFFFPQQSSNISFVRYIPLFTIYYWFFTSYFIVFFAMPMINFVINEWTREQLRRTILTFFILFSILTGSSVGFHKFWTRDAFLLNGGYSPLWLAYVYFLGGFLAKYGISSIFPDKILCRIMNIQYMTFFRNKSYIWTWGGYFDIMFLGFAHLCINSRFGIIKKIYSPSRSYNDPYILIMAVLLFEAFRRTQFPLCLKTIGRICAPYAFGVFLIHAQYDCSALIKNNFSFIANYSVVLHIPMVIICSLSVFVLCCFMDYLRSLLFKLLNIKFYVQKLLGEV